MKAIELSVTMIGSALVMGALARWETHWLRSGVWSKPWVGIGLVLAAVWCVWQLGGSKS